MTPEEQLVVKRKKKKSLFCVLVHYVFIGCIFKSLWACGFIMRELWSEMKLVISFDIWDKQTIAKHTAVSLIWSTLERQTQKWYDGHLSNAGPLWASKKFNHVSCTRDQEQCTANKSSVLIM